MTSRFVLTGDVLNHTAAADVTIGEVLLIGKRIAVALANIKLGETGAIRVKGVAIIAKASANVVAQGALLYWDDTAKQLTTTATANTLAGFAAADAGAGVTTVEISINA